jgi:hypothetical protein
LDAVVIQASSGQSFFLDVAKALIGASVGALFAFGVSIGVHWLQRKKEDEANLQVAVLRLGQMSNEFHVVRKGFRDEWQRLLAANPQLPNFFWRRAIHYTFDDSLKFDFEALSFLLDGPEGIETINCLIAAQMAHHAFVKNVLDYAVAHQELQGKLEAEVIGPDTEFSIEKMTKMAGPVLAARLDALNAGLIHDMEHDEAHYRKASEIASLELKRRFKKKQALKIQMPTD